jgi:endoglucanase
MIKKLLFKRKTLLLTFIFAAMTFTTSVNASASTAWTGIRNISSQQIVNEMKIGWNLGNTLDGTPTEISWGNPKTTHTMIDKIKEAGFNTVRIPVTWDGHMGNSPNYTIDQTWLNRVEEVVNYALDNDMYVIINLHHENDWLKPYYANQTQTTNQLTKVWAQIADRFKWYSDYLVFETMNEPRPVGASNEWSGGSAENRDVINKYNLAAVNTIRGAGGNNASRHIMIPTIAASATSVAINDLVIPNNDSRVIVSLHMYSPYSFAMDINGTSSWGSAADKASLDSEFDSVYNKFVKNGRAVVIGEMGTINKNNTSARVAHAEYYVRAAKARGITPIWWDNGLATAGQAESFAIFNRNTLTWNCPEVPQALMKGLSSPTSSSSVLYNFDSGLDGWTGSNVSGGPWSTTSWKYNGTNSLQGDVKLSSSAQYSLKVSKTQNLSGKSQLKAIVRNATWGSQGTGMIAKLYIKTGSSYTWVDGGAVNINSSTGGTQLTLNLSGVSNINDVKEIGVQFIAAPNASGNSSIYVDYVTIQ